MLPRTVHLPTSMARALHAAAIAAAPREFVALLGGDAGADRLTIDRWHALPNDAHVDGRFLVPPAAFASAEAATRATGHRWLGFVHSHPRGTAQLSGTDRTTLWRGCVQLVLGLRPAASDEPVIRAFWLHGDAAESLPLVSDDPTGVLA